MPKRLKKTWDLSKINQDLGLKSPPKFNVLLRIFILALELQMFTTINSKDNFLHFHNIGPQILE